MGRLKLFIPLVIFVALGLVLFRGLALDPQELPSALIGKPFPQFELPGLHGKTRRTEDLLGEVALINVWATWCIACKIEHPFFTRLAAENIPIYGINSKDEDTAARQWLKELGNPYLFSIADHEGRLGIDLGVYGAPETFLIDAGGGIRYRHVGIVDEQVWEDTLAPLYRQLKDETGASAAP